MKFYSTNFVFKFAWDQVSSAYWNRYPNPWSLHVLSEDVLSRTVEDDKLKTKRLLTKTNRLPKWGERFVSSRIACIVEESIVDPIAKTLTTYTRNITYKTLMVVEEKCVYAVNPQNKEWTTCEKQSWVSSDVYGFARAIEAFGVERYKKNAKKAIKGLEHIMEKLYTPERPPRPPTLPLPQSNMMA
ncbi:PRELI domain-containing protein 1, mitochondrial-like [Actinia tenebrosa]|uniref:PRELI domain-containing protein 1, mitochondrial-like n=1 Tax=Actinia tenebrosa TaxID=6105 RepID=A0A6P8IEM0_ACTTE|nr:PRELI domain-containing protein 1, mitochondrial-like [Actinia tenebrosa]